WAQPILDLRRTTLERAWVSSDGKVHAVSVFGQIYLVTPDGLIPEAIEIGEWTREDYIPPHSDSP
ncbi:MAG TPA: hypothetical protein VGW38_25685, partial [Chloroflexota bacterium]|nr:hypothetical protein [Chloroflexota bacterium]